MIDIYLKFVEILKGLKSEGCRGGWLERVGMLGYGDVIEEIREIYYSGINVLVNILV